MRTCQKRAVHMAKEAIWQKRPVEIGVAHGFKALECNIRADMCACMFGQICMHACTGGYVCVHTSELRIVDTIALSIETLLKHTIMRCIRMQEGGWCIY